MRLLAEIVENQKPLVLPPNATVKDACQRMRDLGVGAVMIVESDRSLTGIFTGRDAVCRVLAEGVSPARTTLSKVMTRAPNFLPPARTAIDALRLMRDGGFRHVPVVDAGRVVGIVSRADFMGIEVDRLDEETGFWEKL